MNYVFDTNALIEIRKGNKSFEEAVKRIVGGNANQPFITLITFSEYYFGCLNAGEEGKKDCLNFLNAFRSLSLTKGSAMLYAELTKKYRKLGLSLDAVDMFIAAITADNGMTLLTLDKGFERLEELKKVVIQTKYDKNAKPQSI